MLILDQRRLARAVKAVLPAAALVLSFAGGLASSPAQAQFFNWGGEGWGFGSWGDHGDLGSMAPGQIYRAIGERGFRIVAPLRRNGAVFVAEVVDRRGRRERLIVSGSSGEILQRFVFTDRRVPRSAALLPGDDLEQQMEHADRGEFAPPLPPASIPDVGGQNRTYGDVHDSPVVEPLRPRLAPRPSRTPKPRLVDRTPDDMQPDRDPGSNQPTRLKARPGEPVRLPNPSSTTEGHPGEPGPVTASRPANPVAKPSVASPRPDAAPAAAANEAPSPRMRDPLAIPRSDQRQDDAPRASASGAAPRRVLPGTVTGAPAAETSAPKSAPPASAKATDVPAAPLD